MDTSLFLLSLGAALLAPVLALAYLRPILLRVLRGLCDAEGTAEFWIRCATLLSVSGTLLLVMLCGEFDAGASIADALRRALLLTMAGVFASVAVISRNVWNQARLAMPLPEPTIVRAPAAGLAPEAR